MITRGDRGHRNRYPPEALATKAYGDHSLKLDDDRVFRHSSILHPAPRDA
jgi:hypothetical protein